MLGWPLTPRLPCRTCGISVATLTLPILTTEPEYTDADLLPEILEKVQRGREMLAGENVDWEVDGGIIPQNVGLAVAAGANVVVSGRGVFHEGAIAQNMAALRAAALEAMQ
ncbi:MAG: hypothetical protein JSW37_12120 [Anaerolineales bacterium]|nr:MAG: hypothetical protein JSW37_12120 [Anaerolineales bacterium]